MRKFHFINKKHYLCLINNYINLIVMRKYISILCLMLLTVFSVQAANKNDSTEFKGHWILQVQGGVSHTVGEAAFGELISPAAAISFGYQFTPVWGLRAGLSGWQGKGAVVYPEQTYKFNYLQGNVDVMVDIVSIFDGYRAKRLFNPYLFAGIGVAGGLNNDEAAEIPTPQTGENSLLWDDLITPVGRFGIGLDIRLCRAVYFNLEVNANMLSDRFNSKKGDVLDWQLHGLAGLTFKFGTAKAKAAEPAPAQFTPTPAPEPEPVPEPAPAPEPAVEEPEVVEPQIVPAEDVLENIYFLIGKSVIRDCEKAKLESVVKAINENENNTVTVTGYADAETGSAERNMELSKERAENVAKALMDAGISEGRIKVEYKGSTVNPYEKPEQNRVAICVVKCFIYE